MIQIFQMKYRTEPFTLGTDAINGTQTFIVVFDKYSPSYESEILSDPHCPAVGKTSYSSNVPGCKCRSVSIAMIDNSRRSFIVTASFSTVQGSIVEKGRYEAPPWERPILVDQPEVEVEEIPATSDAKGTPYRNTAGEALDPPPMKKITHPIICGRFAVRASIAVDTLLAESYRLYDCVNTESIKMGRWTLPKECSLLQSVSAPAQVYPDPETKKSIEYFEISIRFKIIENKLSFPNLGYHQLDKNNKLQPILIGEGANRTHTPVVQPLDTNGKYAPGTKIEIDFVPYKEVSFSSIQSLINMAGNNEQPQ